MSKVKKYSSFSDINGNHYSFESYIDFAVWFFNVPRRRLESSLSAETFRSLEKEATQSSEARKKII